MTMQMFVRRKTVRAAAAIALGLATIATAAIPASAATTGRAVHVDAARTHAAPGRIHDSGRGGGSACEGAGCYTYGYGPFYRGYGYNSNNWCYEGESMYDGC
jgi:hypothetical protein